MHHLFEEFKVHRELEWLKFKHNIEVPEEENRNVHWRWLGELSSRDAPIFKLPSGQLGPDPRIQVYEMLVDYLEFGFYPLPACGYENCCNPWHFMLVEVGAPDPDRPKKLLKAKPPEHKPIAPMEIWTEKETERRLKEKIKREKVWAEEERKMAAAERAEHKAQECLHRSEAQQKVQSFRRLTG